jgi:hypothetical protein
VGLPLSRACESKGFGLPPLEVRDGKVASGRAYLNEAEGLEAGGLSK